MKNKLCLVTGASSGIGKETALGLAKLGAHVILVCRDATRGKAAVKDIEVASGSKKIDLLLADLSSQQDIKLLADTILKRYTKLDVLINNAGTVLTDQSYSCDGIEMTLATNYLGPFLLTHLLLDLLKQSAPSRIINVSSDIYRWGKIDLDDLQFHRRKYQFMKAYAQSKLLMNIFTFELAHRLEGTGVTVNCLHPGAVKTNLGSGSATSWPLKVLDHLIKFFFISPVTAAKTPIYLAVSPEVERVTGRYFAKCKPVNTAGISRDRDLSSKLWVISEKLVGIAST